MSIETAAELERAMAEYHRLADAADGTAEARRRRELDAAIKGYAARHEEEMSPGKPPESAV